MRAATRLRKRPVGTGLRSPDIDRAMRSQKKRVKTKLQQSSVDPPLAQASLPKDLQLILEGITDGLTIMEQSGNLMYANKTAAELVGFDTVAEFLRTPLEQVRARFEVLDERGEKFPLSEIPTRKAWQGTHVPEQLIRFRVLATGEERWSMVRASPIAGDDGKVLYVLTIFHDVTQKIRRERMEKFLAETSNVFSSSLDYETTLTTVSKLIVPHLADWCVFTIVEEDGSYRQLALSHADPEKIRWAKELAERYPADYASDRGLGMVLKTGKPLMVSEVTGDMLLHAARSPEHLELLCTLGMKSVIIVPLVSRDKILGAISLVSAESGQLYDEADFSVAQELAQRAAIAVDNARLYRLAQEELSVRKRTEEELRHLNEMLESRVTERTRELQEARRQDRANLQRLKDMISNMPMAAVSADENLTILHANQRFCDMFSLGEVRGIIGKNGVALLDNAKHVFLQPDAMAQGLRDIFSQKVPVTGVELQLKSGTILSFDYIPIFDEGVHRGHLLLYRDITREKRVDSAKSEFMSLASHQLRTPLTVIRWALSRLRRADVAPSPQWERLLAAAKMASDNMAESINAMLTISRIESDKVVMRQKTIALKQLCADLESECRDLYGVKRQTFHIDCPEDWRLHTDEQLLKEILLNLLRNAVKYTDEGGEITLRVHQEEDTMTIQVCDSGVGIPLREQTKVFQKFFRAQNAIERDPNGTGLGLYLSHITARLLSAMLEFTSEEGVGTTFILRFPNTSYAKNSAPGRR